MPDAVEFLTQQHRQVEQLFTRIQEASPDERTPLVEELSMNLQAHMHIEEEILYPFIRSDVPEGDEMVDEAEDEHAEARQALDAVEQEAPDGGGFTEALTTAMEGVQHHVEEEESEVFPKLRESAGSDRLEQLGTELQQSFEEFMGSASGARRAGGGELIDLTKEELMQRAREADISGRSSMNKDELIQALQNQ